MFLFWESSQLQCSKAVIGRRQLGVESSRSGASLWSEAGGHLLPSSVMKALPNIHDHSLLEYRVDLANRRITLITLPESARSLPNIPRLKPCSRALRDIISTESPPELSFLILRKLR
jgi:hypothetical protein